MTAVDLIYLNTITAMLEGVRADREQAVLSGDAERAGLLGGRIDELLARRDRVSQSFFDFVPAIGVA